MIFENLKIRRSCTPATKHFTCMLDSVWKYSYQQGRDADRAERDAHILNCALYFSWIEFN